MDKKLLKKENLANELDQQQIYNMILKHHFQIEELQKLCDELVETEKTTETYFAGQIYDAYSKILNIFEKAKKDLIVIDSNADRSLLEIMERFNIKVTIITKRNNLLKYQDIKNFNNIHDNLIVKYDDTFEDCYFILDKNIVYHCGASINRIGYKTFSITLINDKTVIDALISRVNQITN